MVRRGCRPVLTATGPGCGAHRGWSRRFGANASVRTATRTVLGGRPTSLFLSFCHLRAFARRRPLPLFKLSTHRNGGVRGTTPLEVGTAVAQLSKLRYKFTNCAIKQPTSRLFLSFLDES